MIFLDKVDPSVSPTKVKDVRKLGLLGVAAAVANAVYNATGAHVRDYSITLDKIVAHLPSI